ncbi:hypothetical protein T492DRAFT_880426 [Pavlovales sp. CCMP2436]|nr:hypothetical protein T492DRAFT_880426 [Pavlovales sp. CCMP2436]
MGLPLAAVVFLDANGEKLVLTRRSAKPVPLAQCGVPPAQRFTYYDQPDGVRPRMRVRRLLSGTR